MPASSGGETLLCDTSFVSVMQSAHRHQDVIATWPDSTRRRLNDAVLAISVITIAELRDGHAYGDWGEARRQRAEVLISAYLQVPLDAPTLDRWAQLSADCRKNGIAIAHNDLWISAAAVTRGWPLVSCDRDFDLIDDVEHLYLPPRL